MSVDLSQLAIDLLKQIILNQIQAATSAQVSGVSSFAQQVANEQIARDQQTFNLLQQLDQHLTAVDAGISNLVSLCQQANQVVKLPSTPPAGYGGASSSSIANAVWAFVVAGDTRSTGDRQVTAGSFANLLGPNFAPLVPDNEFIALVFDYANGAAGAVPTVTPDFDVTTIQLTDATVAAWLNRIDTQGNTWFMNARGFAESNNQITGYGWWLCTIDQLEFDRFKAQLFPSVATLPPTWPGIANVTLGTTLALSDGLLVPGPLSGVIVAISSVSYPVSFYPFGPRKSYVKIGGIVFVDDNGQAELAQPLGLDTNIINAKTMVVADHAYVRLKSGTTGTIQPWLRN